MHKITIVVFTAALPCVLAAGALAQTQTTGKLLEFRVLVEDLGRNPITQIHSGQDFLLEFDVQDIRNPPNDIAQGVFSPYVDISFDNTKAIIPIGATPTFPGSFFNLGSSTSINGTATTLDVGAINGIFFPPTPYNQVQPVFRILMHAAGAGLVTFAPSFDSALGHETLFYDPTDPVSEDQINFVSGSLTIVPEPSTVALATLGLAVLGWWKRSRRKR